MATKYRTDIKAPGRIISHFFVKIDDPPGNLTEKGMTIETVSAGTRYGTGTRFRISKYQIFERGGTARIEYQHMPASGSSAQTTASYNRLLSTVVPTVELTGTLVSYRAKR